MPTWTIPPALVLGAFVLDRIVGDPKHIPHPVVLIGKYIARFEKVANSGTPRGRKLGGVVLTLSTVLGTYWLTWGLLTLAGKLNFWLGLVLTLWLLSTTLAQKSLAQAGLEIYNLLAQGDLPTARQRLAWIVGRDTDHLDEAEVTRATVETVAENIVDGITSPLFYALIGGLPLTMAYKAVNTLDSMVGYKNERYMDFGWASARLDDAANYLPARLTALALVALAFVRRCNWRGAWRVIRRDAPKHPSPNSGYPESAVAGVLGVRLGGYNSYGGKTSFRAYMGDPGRELVSGHIKQTVGLMYASAWLFLGAGLVVSLLARVAVLS